MQSSWPFSHVSHNRDKIICDLTEVLKMGSQLEALEAEALKLTSGERAAFAQLLLASLDEDAEIEEAWAIEIERRIADVESGAAQVIPISEALAQVRAALK
jgi:putative addiction module component (TIGR02574 family)